MTTFAFTLVQTAVVGVVGMALASRYRRLHPERRLRRYQAALVWSAGLLIAATGWLLPFAAFHDERGAVVAALLGLLWSISFALIVGSGLLRFFITPKRGRTSRKQEAQAKFDALPPHIQASFRRSRTLRTMNRLSGVRMDPTEEHATAPRPAASAGSLPPSGAAVIDGTRPATTNVLSSAADLQELVATLRQIAPLVRLLGVPGIDRLVAARTGWPRSGVRWCVGTGYHFLVGHAGDLTRPDLTDEKVIALLADAEPPPPPEFLSFLRARSGRPA